MAKIDSSMVIGAVVVVLGVLAGFSGQIMRCSLGPEEWLTAFPWAGDPDWGVQRWALVDVDERPALLVHERTDNETTVDRLVLLSRDDGEVLGRAYGFDRVEMVATRPGRLWVKEGEAYRAFTLPDLAPDAYLDDVIESFSELTSEVDAVAFPADATAIRLALHDGFQWDIAPELDRVTRLHHDTVQASTPSFGQGTGWCPTEAALPSSRRAMLGPSRRPALRITSAQSPLEAEEVQTRHEGFLDGKFLCRNDGTPIVRPPETVFLLHREEVDGRLELLLSRIDGPAGLAWTRSLRDLDPVLFDGTRIDVLYVEDQGVELVLWLRARESDSDWSPGYDLLVALDLERGEARWQSAF